MRLGPRLPGGSRCTSADSGLPSPSSLPAPSPALALARGVELLVLWVSLRRGGGDPSRRTPSPALPASRGQVSSAGRRRELQQRGGAEALHHCSGLAGGAPLPRSRPDGHLPAAARSGRRDVPGL